MKKTLLYSAVVITLVLSVVGCTPMRGLSPDQAAIAKAATSAELQTLLQRYYQDKNYPMALSAAEKILELDPSDEGMYVTKAELWIAVIKDAHDSLNSLLKQDLGKVTDPTGYRDQVTRMYEAAGLQLSFPFVPDYSSIEEINTVGNTSVNLRGIMWTDKAALGGLFAPQGKWIYYSNYSNNFALYKMSLDGEQKQPVCADAACNINVVGDWVYFTNLSDDNALYKIRTDGSMKTRLSEDGCESLCVSGDWVYYVSANDGIIYRVRTDGSERMQFSKPGQSLFIDAEWLYFTSRDGRDLTRVRLDGSNQERLINGQWNQWTQVYDGWLYYLTDIKGMVIMRTRLDSSERSEVWRYPGKINFFTVAGDRMIVSVRGHIESVMAFDLTTMKQVLQLDNTSTEAICTAGETHVYFSAALDNNAWYRINWETGAAERVE